MFGKSDVITLELLFIVGIYFVSVDARAQVAIIYSCTCLMRLMLGHVVVWVELPV